MFVSNQGGANYTTFSESQVEHSSVVALGNQALHRVEKVSYGPVIFDSVRRLDVAES